MIILSIIFSLLHGKTITHISQFSPMEISDALPVQFWLTGCATYNEHLASGVHHKCYCAPWECDDNIKIQFKDDPSQNFSLLVLDENAAILDEIAIEETSVGVYELGYIPSAASPEICEQTIKLQIRKEAGSQGIVLPPLADWLQTTEYTAGAVNWVLGSAPFLAINGAGIFLGVISELLYTDFAFISGVEYTITINYDKVVIDPDSNPRALKIYILDNSFNILAGDLPGDGCSTPISGGTSIDCTYEFTAPSGATKLAVRIAEGSDVEYTINSASGTRSLGSAEIVAKTDCLDIRQDHPDTILLTYSNHRNFAGLVYENISPENEFQIRIPAIFFHQRFPEEDEVIELSSSLLTLNGTLRKQRLMDIDYVPYYFHEKLKLILKHQILEIFSRQWVKQESYEITEGDRRWPVKKAKVWLSEKDFVHRNIL